MRISFDQIQVLIAARATGTCSADDRQMLVRLLTAQSTSTGTLDLDATPEETRAYVHWLDGTATARQRRLSSSLARRAMHLLRQHRESNPALGAIDIA